MIENAKAVKTRLKKIISEEQFCLHFDGKKIDNKEYQVVCLKNSTRTLHLGILACESGSANDIFVPLPVLLDEYNAWNSMQMIISDTTAVNTSKKSGIVIRLQRQFRQKGLPYPQFIGCQHHVLDLILAAVRIRFLFSNNISFTWDELQVH